MMTEWRQTKLGEISQIYSGFAFRSQDLGERGIPVLKIANIQSKRVSPDCSDHLAEKLCTDKLDRYFLHPNDTLIAMTGAGSVGKVGKMPCTAGRFLVNQRVAIVRPDASRCDPAFVYFALSQDYYEAKLYGLGLGAGQPNISAKQIGELELPFPPLPTQRRIAGILSAFDELIENNQRRIKILEEMAQSLYREWFVHFRFPGHDKVKMVPSPLGPIPQDWEVKRVPECVDITPRVIVPLDGEKPFVPMGCLSNDSMLISDIESRDGNSGAKFQNGDTLFARITPCLENGKTGFVQFLPDEQAVACGSTEFIVLRSRTLTPEIVYLLARSDEFRRVAIKSMTGATGRQRVQEQCFNDFKIAQSPCALLNRFSAIVAPSFRLIYKLHLQIQNLRRTRDLLLPRLLSGQVNVA
jgi:type I restriction enzyme S subunit